MKVARFVWPFVLFAFATALAQNPVPLVNQPLVPDAVAPGGSGFTLTVNGTGFVSGAVVNWDETGLVTTFVSESQLTATVPAADISAAGTGSVTVTNPTPGSGTSNVQYVGVAYPTSPITAASAVNYGTGGSSSNWVVVADVNGDHIPDLVVVNQCVSPTNCNTGTVAVLLGNGDGTFQSAVPYSTGEGGADFVAVADVNGDGKPDLLVVDNNGCCTDSSVSVLLGNGNGTFQAAVAYDSGGIFANAVAAADVNGDGKLDLVVENFCDNIDECDLIARGNVGVLLGNGDGTFQTTVVYELSGTFAVAGVEVADVNGDGKLDLLVADGGGGTVPGEVAVLLGNGDGTFQTAVGYGTGGSTTSMALADVNGDGRPDLLVWDNSDVDVGCGANGFEPCLGVLLGNGDGTFQTVVLYDLGGAPSSFIEAADINGDGKLDLILAGGNNVAELLGNGDGTFQTAVAFGSGGNGESAMAVADVNGDGKPDFVVTSNCSNCSAGTVGILINTSGLVTATALASSRNPSSLGQAVTFTATVTAQSGGTPTGTVSFYDGTTNIGGTNLNGSGVATFTTSGLAVGTHSMTATYNGGANFGVSTSPVLNQVVQGGTVSLSPGSLDFGSQDVGIMSAPQGVTLQNTGNFTLGVTSIQIIGANGGDFAQTNNCPASLSPNSSCNINVTFTPTAAGTRNAAVSISDNAPGSPQSVPLTGVGDQPVVNFSPPDVTFPGQYVGTSGLPQTLTVTNNGAVPLVVTKLTTSIADFGTLNDCTNAVPPGMNCTIGVFFDPTASGTRTGTLLITDNASGSPQSVPLSGTGQDFSMASSGSATATVSPGGTAKYTLAVAPGGGFKQTVSFTCSGAPAGFICSVPSSVVLNGSSTTMVTVTVASGTSARLTRPGGFSPVGSRLAMWLALGGLPGLVILGGASAGRRRSRRVLCGLAFVCLFSLAITWTGCGGGSGGGSGPGTYNLTVTGKFTSGATTLTHNTNLTLVVR